MKSGGGKRKGAAFEREVCVSLSRWLTSASNNKRDDIFWRSAMSGGRSTVAKRQNKTLANQAGDLSAIDPLGHKFIDKFIVECKHLRSLGLESAIKGHGVLPDIWAKLGGQEIDYGKDAFLVMKQNNWPILLGLHPATFDHYCGKHINALVSYPRLKLNIYYFDEWLSKIDPRIFQ